MRLARLTSIALAYGCHEGRFPLPTRRVPIVIYGSNGAGKTTLIEALVTSVYGFDVRADAKRLRDRMPWTGERFWSRIEFFLMDPFEEQAFAIERDFLSQHAVVTRLSDGAELFRGDADPGSVTPEAQQFRRWVGEHFGLDTRRAYEMTACIHQGELTRTRLGEHLLRIAAGGYTQLSSARAEVERRYYSLTREPMTEGLSRRTADGALDAAEQHVLALEHRAGDLRRLLERRYGVLRERDGLLQDLAQVRIDLSQLESALPLLNERRVMRERRDRTAERVSWLDTLHRDLNQAVVRVESADQAWDVLKAGPVYPDDFLERAAVLEELWTQAAAVDREIQEKQAAVDRSIPVSSWLAWLLGTISFLAVAAGAWLFGGLDRPIEGGVAVVLGAVGLIALIVWRQASDRRWREALSALEGVAVRQRNLAARIQGKVRDLPEAETLRAETLPDRRQRFETQRRARAAREDTRRRLNDVLSRTVEDLSAHGRAEDVPATAGPGRVTPAALLEAMLTGLGGVETAADTASIPPSAVRLLEELQLAASTERQLLSEGDLELRRTLEWPIQVPSDVTADAMQVEAALAERRARRDAGDERLRALDARLAADARVDDSLVGVETALSAARTLWETLAHTTDVNRRALGLLNDAYVEFHRADEQRLLGAISGQLHALSDGTLGPFVATEGLEDVRVMLGERTVPLESPPLSYGEYHAVLLAARFGTADFLARVGVRPPVIVDEPFTHLDEQRAARVWELLAAVARERQVIVATQDRRILDALGITPDIELRPPRERDPAPPAADEAPSSELPVLPQALRDELARWKEGE